MALMLTDKTATFRSTHDKARMQDPAILRLRAKVRLEAPGGEGAGAPLLEITMADGTRLAQRAGPVLGTIDNPMTRDQLVAKCHDLMTPVLTTARSGRLIDRVLEFDKTNNIRELRPFLQRTSHTGPPRLSDYPAANSGSPWRSERPK